MTLHAYPALLPGSAQQQAGIAWDPGVQADALGITDSVSILVSRNVAQDDALGLADNLSSIAAFVRQIDDALGMTDAIAAGRLLAQLVNDALKVSDSALSYRQEVIADSPEMWNRMEELSGLTLADSSGHGHVGTLANAAFNYGVAGQIAGSTALDFDLTAVATWTGYSPFVNGTQRTFEFWLMLPSSYSGDYNIMSSTGTDAVRFRVVQANNNIVFDPNVPGGGGSLTWTGGWPDRDVFHHLVLVFDEVADTAEAYLDGASLGVKAETEQWGASAGDLRQQLRGTVDEFVIYNSALSAARIKAHYQAGVNAGAVVLDHPVAINDALGITDAVSLAQVKALADALAATDTASLAQATALMDALGVTDQVTPAGLYARTVSDALGLTDQATPSQGWIRVQNDAAGITDQAVRGLGKSQDDALGVTDARVFAVAAVVADALGITDNQNVEFSGGKQISVDDDLSIVDLMTPVSDTQRAVSDSLAMVDQVLAGQGYGRQVADALGVTDASVFARTLQLDDLLAATDLLTAAQGYARQQDDAFTIVDLLTFARAFQQQDALSVSDTLGVFQGYGVVLTDLLQIQDLLAYRADWAKSVGDLLVVTDLATPVKSTPGFVVIEDVLTVTDQVRTLLALRRLLVFVRHFASTNLWTDEIVQLLTTRHEIEETVPDEEGSLLTVRHVVEKESLE